MRPYTPVIGGVEQEKRERLRQTLTGVRAQRNFLPLSKKKEPKPANKAL